MTMDDLAHMRAALGLARRGVGLVAPNPAVGCVLVKDGVVVGRGWTQPGGRPHAETEALRRAGERAWGSTAYVTLEPCAHHGKTPPCADALMQAGITRVVAALEDPDPRVAGRGLARLRDAGVDVVLGPGAAEAEEINAGFLKRVRVGKPLVTLKLASSLDGRIATHGGQSQWITGVEARTRGHLLRRRHDAVMVGSGTVLADDPELTVRLPGLENPAPLRIVVDGRLRTPLTARLVKSAKDVRTLLVTLPRADPTRLGVFRDCGVEILEVPADATGSIDPHLMLQALGDYGLTRILVEGGATLAAALLAAQAVDRIAWFRSPSIIGGDGLPAVKSIGVELLADQTRLVRQAVVSCGDDLLETLSRAD
jgi:diaminohydroxyphosphoribosylaminopyrimidine deaminase/5-amino-6-(5-phosphoribosylamino)uracil reductase